MYNNQTKFPFKYFLGIIDTLEKEDALSAWQIAKSISSCIADASEATRMLQYLTHYGKIISNPEKGKWRIIRREEDSGSPSKNFRVKYIKKLITVIESLTDELQSAEELVNRTSLELNELEEILPDLCLLTEKGYVDLQGSGPRQKWCLNPWPPDIF